MGVRYRYPCLSCDKPVRSNENAVKCVSCHKWIHLLCSKIENDFYHSDLDWICSHCLFSELPFQEEEDDHVDDIDIDKENSVNSEINFDAVCSELKSISGISIAHLNVCSLLKNIDEIRLLLDEAKINILTMCEARLDDSVSDNEIYIDGYNTVRNDRTEMEVELLCIYITHTWLSRILLNIRTTI